MSTQRSIFEDVKTDKPADETSKGGFIDAGRAGARKAIAFWLLLLFFFSSLHDTCGWTYPVDR